MNCKNCGAPMSLNRDRHYYHCEYCSSYHFPAGSPDGLRLLGQAPEGSECPICHEPLTLVSLDDRWRGYHCQKCRGLLIVRPAFAQTVQSRRAWAKQPPVAPQPLDRRELDRRLRCPQCRQPMATHPYYGPGTIVIDTCERCDLIWLDYGELEEAVNAPGHDRGSAYRPKAKAEPLEMRDRPEPRWGRRRVDLVDLLDDLFS
jgi:Zn-finger nucleic acid-binding protein